VVVTIGSMNALCPICGCETFRCPEKHPTTLDVMTCTNCGTRVTYGFLTEQIAQRSIHEMDAALKAAKDRKRPAG
jgi:hypothetical protein